MSLKLVGMVALAGISAVAAYLLIFRKKEEDSNEDQEEVEVIKPTEKESPINETSHNQVDEVVAENKQSGHPEEAAAIQIESTKTEVADIVTQIETEAEDMTNKTESLMEWIDRQLAESRSRNATPAPESHYDGVEKEAEATDEKGELNEKDDVVVSVSEEQYSADELKESEASDLTTEVKNVNSEAIETDEKDISDEQASLDDADKMDDSLDSIEIIEMVDIENDATQEEDVKQMKDHNSDDSEATNHELLKFDFQDQDSKSADVTEAIIIEKNDIKMGIVHSEHDDTLENQSLEISETSELCQDKRESEDSEMSTKEVTPLEMSDTTTDNKNDPLSQDDDILEETEHEIESAADLDVDIKDETNISNDSDSEGLSDQMDLAVTVKVAVSDNLEKTPTETNIEPRKTEADPEIKSDMNETNKELTVNDDSEKHLVSELATVSNISKENNPLEDLNVLPQKEEITEKDCTDEKTDAPEKDQIDTNAESDRESTKSPDKSDLAEISDFANSDDLANHTESELLKDSKCIDTKLIVEDSDVEIQLLKGSSENKSSILEDSDSSGNFSDSGSVDDNKNEDVIKSEDGENEKDELNDSIGLMLRPSWQLKNPQKPKSELDAVKLTSI